jgi:hypothetical protein
MRWFSKAASFVLGLMLALSLTGRPQQASAPAASPASSPDRDWAVVDITKTGEEWDVLTSSVIRGVVNGQPSILARVRRVSAAGQKTYLVMIRAAHCLQTAGDMLAIPDDGSPAQTFTFSRFEVSVATNVAAALCAMRR